MGAGAGAPLSSAREEIAPGLPRRAERHGREMAENVAAIDGERKSVEPIAPVTDRSGGEA